MRIKALALVAALGLFYAGHAIAQPPDRPDGPGGPDQPPRAGGPGGPGGFFRMLPIMSALDKDGDGTISAREIKKAVNALKTLDQNDDGDLTEDELQPKFPGGPGGPRGGGADGPGGPRGQGGPGGPGFGGPPGPEAFVARAMQFDEDGDGKLSREELTKLAEQIGRRPPEGGPGGGGPRGSRPEGKGRPPRDPDAEK